MSTLKENIEYYLKPETVAKLEKPFDDYDEKDKGRIKNSTEIATDAIDKLDVDVVSASSYSSLLQVNSMEAYNINDLIQTYRKTSELGFVNEAIWEIVNGAIYKEDHNQNPISLAFNDPQNKLKENIKEKILNEFEYLLDILDFDDTADEYFRRWYIDGRLIIQLVYDEKKIDEGIKKVKLMSPLFLKRHEDKKTGKKYWVYDNSDIKSKTNSNTYQEMTETAVVIPDELLIMVPSGIYDRDMRFPISYLHYAQRDINRLDTLEDHFLIYRVVRAPERRVFYIDPGNLPPKKAEEYLRQVMNTYAQKKVYDDANGTLVSKNKHPSILEDFFLLRRNGKGTEIDTLAGGGDLGSIDDLHYFKTKAYKALNVPMGRMSEDGKDNTPVVNQTANEITREELKFSKYIDRLRTKFNYLFKQLLKTQLIRKKIISKHEWDDIRRKLVFNYKSDTQFVQAKRLNLLQQKLEIVRDAEEYSGKWLSKRDIHKLVFDRSDEDIKKFYKGIEEERTLYPDDDDV
jgi:hypothetical protein